MQPTPRSPVPGLACVLQGVYVPYQPWDLCAQQAPGLAPGLDVALHVAQGLGCRLHLVLWSEHCDAFSACDLGSILCATCSM